MGAGMQQPPMQGGGGGGAVSAMLDVFKVLYEPGAVFERVAAKPSFLMPFIVVVVVQIIIGIVNLPFMQAAMKVQMAAAGAPAGGPDPSKFAVVGLAFIPIVICILLVISAFLLWVLVSLVGGEGKFEMLLSVATYCSVP